MLMFVSVFVSDLLVNKGGLSLIMLPLIVIFLLLSVGRTVTQEDPGDNQVTLEEIAQMVGGNQSNHSPVFLVFVVVVVGIPQRVRVLLSGYGGVQDGAV